MMDAETMVERFVEAGSWVRTWPQYIYRYVPAGADWDVCAVGDLTDDVSEDPDYEVYAYVEASRVP